MTSRQLCLSAAAAAVLAAIIARPTAAVIVAGDYINVSDSDVNTTPPPSDPGFYNVGKVGVGSAIYLGDDWVLTAGHLTLGPTTFSFPDRANPSQLDTVSYNFIPNSGFFLTNPAGVMHPGSNSDLFLYKIDSSTSAYGEPNLPNLLLAQSTPELGSTVMAIGNGVDRDASLTYWNNTAPYWQTTSQALAAHTGYVTTGPQELRWGTNTVTSTGGQSNLGTDPNQRWTQTFATNFSNDASATSNEFQVTQGDSGGAVFSLVGNVWMLSGMIESVNLVNNNQPYPTVNGQPATAAFTQTSVLADLSIYRSQILAHVPLPGDANGDGIVNGQDIAMIASMWLQVGTNLAGDLNHDGIVNGQDIAMVGSLWTGPTSNTPKSGGGFGASGGTNNVPEPGTALLALSGCVLLWLAVRRKR